MKKLFPLHEEGKAPARVVEAVKHEVRKYVKRERRKELPEDSDRWAFACKVGATSASAASCTLDEISARIDDVVNAGGADVYVEVIAAPVRKPGAEGAAAPAEEHGPESSQ